MYLLPLEFVFLGEISATCYAYARDLAQYNITDEIFYLQIYIFLNSYTVVHTTLQIK